MNVLTLLAAAYNVSIFLFMKKGRKVLIILFYFTVFAVTLIVVAMSIFVIKTTPNAIDSNTFLTLDVFKAFAIEVMYWTVGLSMFQLGVSI